MIEMFDIDNMKNLGYYKQEVARRRAVSLSEGMRVEKQETEITLQTVIGQAETGSKRSVAVSVGNIRVVNSFLLILSHLVTARWESRDGGIGEVGCRNVVLLWWGAVLHNTQG
jgi:hypothetical protein